MKKIIATLVASLLMTTYALADPKISVVDGLACNTKEHIETLLKERWGEEHVDTTTLEDGDYVLFTNADTGTFSALKVVKKGEMVKGNVMNAEGYCLVYFGNSLKPGDALPGFGVPL